MSDIVQKIVTEGISVSGKGVIEIPIDQILIGQHIIQQADILIQNLNIGSKALIVSDENTSKVLAKQLYHILKSMFQIREYVYTGHVEADMTAVNALTKEIKDTDFIIAVGSGTINDICKLASYQAGITYIVWGTAPSMNGYCSANASITVNGYKSSLQAHLPKAVYMDSHILINAPIRLIRSGVGDILCRITCQADWMLSHLIFKTKYLNEPFDLLEQDETYLINNSDALSTKDPKYIECLVRMLLLSGLGMYISGGSYPASQAEHMIEHTFGMMKHDDELPTNYHGEEIAVTTLKMLEIQQQLLEAKQVKFNTYLDEKKVRAYFNQQVADEILNVYRMKQAEYAKIDSINWDKIKGKLEKILSKKQAIITCLSKINAPQQAADLGWKKNEYELAVVCAQYSRMRYTFLDLKIA
ncbi:MAG: iron-containing alcohol dehydrogenase [Rickettsiales bacterium]|nr:iron-containing alcohol dehydrogenase [Rickettsiales bacterium]